MNVAGISSEALAVGDFNGDAIPDLAIVNASQMATVLLGDGTGTFTTSWTGSVGTTFDVAGLAVADINGDGISDLVLANGDYDGANSDVTVLLGKGDGTFTVRPSLHVTGTFGYEAGLAVGDFNGDGIPDLVTNGSVLVNNGDGTFTVTSALTNVWSMFIAVGDFNGDGLSDLEVSTLP